MAKTAILIIFSLCFQAILSEKISPSCENPGSDYELLRCDSVFNIAGKYCWTPIRSCGLECDGLCEIEPDV